MITPFEKTVMINAPATKVWEALTVPGKMTQWMGEPEMELSVETDWRAGGPFAIRGFHPMRFENKGQVMQFEPLRTLAYTHLSSVSKLPDLAANYTLFTFELRSDGAQTVLSLTISNFPTLVIYQHLAFYWRATMEKIRLYVEADTSVV